jgi:hypothetical protein
VFIALAGPAVVLAKRLNRPIGGRGGSARSGGSRSRSRAGRRGGASRSTGFGKGRGGSLSKAKTGTRVGGAAGGSRAGRTSGGRGSWFFKAWNASGAPKTSETSFRGASAVLTGKAAGTAARGGWWVSKKTGKAGRWFAGSALIPFDKWLERKRAGLENAAGLPEPQTSTPDSKPEPVRTPPPVFVNPKNRTSKGVPVNGPTTSAAVPATLQPHLTYIEEFEPENDADLLNMLAAEVHGMHGLAEAANAMFENCVTEHGLDPAAMQGIQDYAEAFSEAAATVARAHEQFKSVYEAIIEAANNGTQMPYNGRFFSGEAAA